MYLGASAFVIVVGIILVAVPRDATRTLPLDVLGISLIAIGAAVLLVNAVRRLRSRRARTQLDRAGKPVSTFNPPSRGRRRAT